jgi:hypothetical protein
MHILHGQEYVCKLVATPDNLDLSKFFCVIFLNFTVPNLKIERTEI